MTLVNCHISIRNWVSGSLIGSDGVWVIGIELYLKYYIGFSIPESHGSSFTCTCRPINIMLANIIRTRTVHKDLPIRLFCVMSVMCINKASGHNGAHKVSLLEISIKGGLYNYPVVVVA